MGERWVLTQSGGKGRQEERYPQMSPGLKDKQALARKTLQSEKRLEEKEGKLQTGEAGREQDHGGC